MARQALLLLILFTAGAASAQPATDGVGRDKAGATAPEVQAAPGGGEMVVLDPERQFVVRAWTDAGGRMRVGCSDQPPDAKTPGAADK